LSDLQVVVNILIILIVAGSTTLSPGGFVFLFFHGTALFPGAFVFIVVHGADAPFPWPVLFFVFVDRSASLLFDPGGSGILLHCGPSFDDPSNTESPKGKDASHHPNDTSDPDFAIHCKEHEPNSHKYGNQ
jgi:hypothetical protein